MSINPFSYSFRGLPAKEQHISMIFFYFSLLGIIFACSSIFFFKNIEDLISNLTFLFGSLIILFMVPKLPENGWINGDVYKCIFYTFFIEAFIINFMYIYKRNSFELWAYLVFTIFLLLLLFYGFSVFSEKYVRFVGKKHFTVSSLIETLENKGYDVSVKSVNITYKAIIKLKDIIDLPDIGTKIYISSRMILVSKNVHHKKDIREIMRIIDLEMRND